MFLQVVLPVVLIVGIMLAFSFPIYLAMLTAAIYLQVFVNQMPLLTIFSGMFESLARNTLLAVPFFVVSGNLLATGSLGKRLVDFCGVFMKKIPGGMALTCIGANAIFGAISGSAPAATATFGKILWHPLKDTYGEKEAAGLITSSGSLSTIIPPSMSLIMFGLVTETSVAKLFTAGFLPGILMVVVLAVYLSVKYRKSAAGATWQPGERMTAFKRGIPALLLPVIILGGIYGGFCSPTEAGAIATLYAAVVSLFFIRDINLRQFAKVFIDSGKTVATIFVLIAVSNVFSQALTITQAPQALQSLMQGISPFMYLLLINVVLVIAGCFLDPSAANLIVSPILVPIGVALGLSSVHLGVIYAVNLSIGMFTPPYGLSLFVSQTILDRPIGLIVRGCVPYMICYGIVLIVITYVPEISLFLPRILS